MDAPTLGALVAAILKPDRRNGLSLYGRERFISEREIATACDFVDDIHRIMDVKHSAARDQHVNEYFVNTTVTAFGRAFKPLAQTLLEQVEQWLVRQEKTFSMDNKIPGFVPGKSDKYSELKQWCLRLRTRYEPSRCE